MRRWDRLVDGYIEEYRARGISDAVVSGDDHGNANPVGKRRSS
jgi:hypothetical protein